jgi:nitroimidazol reductase NimA-like FMN-containing flavoprotein (pyridoxamine 5'-phosphate oxidase superfamily)
MTGQEIRQLLKEQILCRIAFGGNIAPYIAPFQYAYFDDHLYFHFTDYGKKIGLLEEGNSVCVEIEKYTPDMSEYRFVVLTGNLRLVTEPKERIKAMEEMVNIAKKKQLSKNFLLAHGVSSEESWDFLTPDKPFLIVKLEQVSEVTGLKSPN